jgi:hypothetical protein
LHQGKRFCGLQHYDNAACRREEHAAAAGPSAEEVKRVAIRHRGADAGLGTAEDQVSKSRQSTYPLRLPRSVKAEVERRARADGISVNQFVATAVSEKLAVMNTVAFFADRRARANFPAFDRLMRRKCGEPPPSEDKIR